jgi:hypothetical protein
MYKFDPNGKSVEETFRAIALSQLDEALAELRDAGSHGRSVLHEARRRCKKLRGLLRLVRPAFADFAKENAAVRDAAGLLSHLRDAEVLQHTVLDLTKWSKRPELERIAARLDGKTDDGSTAQLDEFGRRLGEIRERAGRWTLKRDGSAALLPGLRNNYRSARRRMRVAHRTRLAADMHDWRKANKYYGFHIDLLKKTAPEMLVDDLRVVEELSTLLGLHHDLAILAEAIAANPDRFGDASDLAALAEVLQTRKEQVGTDAFRIGRQVFAEEPHAVGERYASYWTGVL